MVTLKQIYDLSFILLHVFSLVPTPIWKKMWQANADKINEKWYLNQVNSWKAIAFSNH